MEAKTSTTKELDTAANIGTQCHQAIDEYIFNRPFEGMLKDNEAKMAFKNFQEWVKNQKITFLKGDTIVASKNYQFGGRFDAIATNENNDVILMDWKTSSGIRTSYDFQLGGYAIGLEETYGISATKGYIVRFAKDSPIVEEHEVFLDDAKEGFINLCNIKKILEKIKKIKKKIN